MENEEIPPSFPAPVTAAPAPQPLRFVFSKKISPIVPQHDPNTNKIRVESQPPRPIQQKIQNERREFPLSYGHSDFNLPVCDSSFSQRYDNSAFPLIITRLRNVWEAYLRQMGLQVQPEAFEFLMHALLKKFSVLLASAIQFSKLRTGFYAPENSKITLNQYLNFYWLRMEHSAISNIDKRFLEQEENFNWKFYSSELINPNLQSLSGSLEEKEGIQQLISNFQSMAERDKRLVLKDMPKAEQFQTQAQEAEKTWQRWAQSPANENLKDLKPRDVPAFRSVERSKYLVQHRIIELGDLELAIYLFNPSYMEIVLFRRSSIRFELYGKRKSKEGNRGIEQWMSMKI